jgi:hypothetical protein
MVPRYRNNFVISNRDILGATTLTARAEFAEALAKRPEIKDKPVIDKQRSSPRIDSID